MKQITGSNYSLPIFRPPVGLCHFSDNSILWLIDSYIIGSAPCPKIIFNRQNHLWQFILNEFERHGYFNGVCETGIGPS